MPTSNIVEMTKKINDRKEKEAESIPGKDSGGDGVDSDFIRQCVWDNEMGDGMLFAALYRGKLIYNHNSQEWLIWKGHHFGIDEEHEAIIKTIDVLRAYQSERKLVKRDLQNAKDAENGKQEKYLKLLDKEFGKSIARLKKNKGKAGTLRAAVEIPNPLATSGFDLNKNPWLLACANGVINLKDGSFADGNPEQLITKASPVEFPGLNKKAKKFRKFLKEVMADDEDKVMFLLKVLGYSLTGLQKEQIFLMLYGQHGRNGKGVIINLLGYILGPLCVKIPVEMLLKSKYGRNSAGPSPDIMSFKDVRIAWGSEPDDKQKFNIGAVKSYSGAEILSARAPHDKRATNFTPTHTLLLFANEKPSSKADDDAFWHRLRLVSFPYSYVNNPDPDKPYQKQINKNLEEELLEEAPAILAELVRAAVLWRKTGLDVPESMEKEMHDWRRSEDPLSDFIDQCLVKVSLDVKTTSKSIYDVFYNWWLLNRTKDKDKVPAKRTFGEWMAANFIRCKVSGGNIAYKGVELKPELPIELTMTLNT